ncbi:MAG: efflux RND transporter periplasmic adaptor subunit [Acidimicrobiia bacterium]|nr:efflux RND transporter periplasmic adaptor subunit [Acidimicrobiia bacterium]
MRLMVVVMIFLLAACGGNKEPVVQAETKTEDGPSKTQVSLSEEALRLGGIEVQEVTRRAVQAEVRITGRLTVDVNRTWFVGAVTDGRVVKTYVTVGDRVEAGQVLARMHSHDVHEGRAEYQKAVSERARAQTAEGFAKRFRDRAQRLYELKAGSLQDLERAEADWKNAQSAVLQAEVEVQRARTHLVDYLGVPAEEPPDHKAGEHEGDEDLIPVRAPAAGAVIEKKVTPGTVVAPASEMFVVSDLGQIWMMAAAGEEHLPLIKPPKPASVTVQAYPGRVFPGRLTRIGDQLDAETRTAQARVELANPGNLLKPEMYAEAVIQTPGGGEAVLIPEESLQEIKGQTAVFLERAPAQFEAVAVETKPAYGGKLEVVSGLKPGDRLVTRGAFTLKSQLLRSSLAEE